MTPTALMVNTAPADLIAPGALLEALRNGKPGFAAVDVYDQEPVVNGDHPHLDAECGVQAASRWEEWTNFELYFRETLERIVVFEQGKPLRLANPNVVPRKVVGESREK
jgi:D-3-phosphoglycerate dehydrogenase